MLAQVVGVGTGTQAAIEGYTVAGKTGTARKPSNEFRGYEEGVYMSSFAGFVPAEDPQLSAIVVLDDPQPYYAGLVAAPIFAEISRYGLRQLRIPPPPPAPDLVAAVPKAAAEDAARADGAPATPGPSAPPPTVRSAPATVPPSAPLLAGG
jgi:membrane peptidoglycan carboxypeptidase